MEKSQLFFSPWVTCGGEGRERERENADKKQEVFFRCLVHHRNNKLRKLLTLVSLAPHV